ncbi:MAG: SLC13 family permease [Haliangiales bacterium]
MAITLVVTVGTIVALVVEVTSPEVVFMAAVTVLVLAGVLSPEAAVAGFGDTTVLIIAALFMLGDGVRRTGVLTQVGDRLLGRAGERAPLLRLMLPAAGLSTVLGNTLIVAVLVPAVIDWCRSHNVVPSRLLMPLSFATILGGTITLIGTSTNLVVAGFMVARGMPGLGMFELAWVGVPVTLAGVGFMALAAGRLLPGRRDPLAALGSERRKYFVEVVVEDGGRLVGQSLDEAGLAELPGLRVVRIERSGVRLSTDDASLALASGDRLLLAGAAAAVVALRRISGVVPTPEGHYDPQGVERRNQLFEAVVSRASPLVGTSIQDEGFGRYDASVLAIHRGGRELVQGIGATELRPGDTLMVEADETFADRWGNMGDFALVSRIQSEPRPVRGKALQVSAILAVMVAAIALGWLSVIAATFSAIGLMIVLGVLTPSQARRSVRLTVIISIAGALALGHALEDTGAAAQVAALLVDAAGDLGPLGLLAITFALAVLLSAFVTNVAAAAMVFPIVIDAALLAGYEPRPFAIALAIGCSSSFLTPFGYQTNLMIYGPGGYRFGDFVRLGLPLTVVVGGVCVALIPQIWPLVA